MSLEGATRELRIQLINPAALWVFDAIHPDTVAAVETVDRGFVGATLGDKGAQHGCSGGRSKKAPAAFGDLSIKRGSKPLLE